MKINIWRTVSFVLAGCLIVSLVLSGAFWLDAKQETIYWKNEAQECERELVGTRAELINARGELISLKNDCWQAIEDRKILEAGLDSCRESYAELLGEYTKTVSGEAKK